MPPEQVSRERIHACWPHEGPLRDAVLALKFGAHLALAGPLGRLLAAHPRLLELADGGPVERVIPVPLHWRRRLVRGFDQSEQLARWALHHVARIHPHRPHPTLETRALRRIRHTLPQTTLDRRDREHNVEGAFVVRKRERVAGRRVLLIDDVTTTGATARACAHALTQAGAARVETLTLLRALGSSP